MLKWIGVKKELKELHDIRGWPTGKEQENVFANYAIGKNKKFVIF